MTLLAYFSILTSNQVYNNDKINNGQIWSNSENQSLKYVDHFKFYIMGNYLSYLDSQQYPDFCGLLVLSTFEYILK